jgi:hypothetical protein
MTFKIIMEQLSIIEEDIDSIQSEIISQCNLLKNETFLLRREELLFNSAEMKLLKIKKNNIVRINPLNKKYNEYELLEIYPFYFINNLQKNKINKNINKIMKEGQEKTLFNLFLYLFLENKEKEMLAVFKLLAKLGNIKTLKIMSTYFLFKNHIVNYTKVNKLIKKISK